MRRFSVLLLILGLAVVLMGAEAGSARAALAADAATPSPSASDFSRSVVGVTGVVVGDAASPSPAPSSIATTTPAPIESIAGETSGPYSGATPPPTSSWSDLGGAASATPILLLICLALACGLLAAVQYQRRKRLE